MKNSQNTSPKRTLRRPYWRKTQSLRTLNSKRKLDDFLKQLVNTNSTLLAGDSTLERIQGRILQTTGPLARLWSQIEDARVAGRKGEEIYVPLEDYSKLVEQTILVLGQASNSISYTRRMDVLKQVVKDPRKAKNLLKEKKDLLNQEDEELFGKKIQSYIVETEKSRKRALDVLKEKKTTKHSNSSAVGGYYNNNNNKRPFRGGPPSSVRTSNTHGGGRFVYNNQNQNGRYTGKSYGKNYGNSNNNHNNG